MSFNLHQTPEEIIKAATPEQRVLWNYIFLTFGERVSISQLNYSGVVAATEFLTYTARKLYLALEFGYSNTIATNLIPLVNVYNEANAVKMILSNNTHCVYWDATAAAAVVNNMGNSGVANNFYFSRIAPHATITYIKFIGYRLQY